MLNSQDFFLQGNVDFKERQKSVFSALDLLAPENAKQRYSSDEFKKTQKVTVVSSKKELKQFRGQESIFKRPELPLKRSFKIAIPDYVKNPHKWKKYKLDDDVMTDESNTAAAMAFLKEMRSRNEPMECEPPMEGVSSAILFNKHVSSDGQLLAVEEKVSYTFNKSKTVMPEYVVGQKKKKTVTFKKPDPVETPTSSVKLQHLYIDEE